MNTVDPQGQPIDERFRDDTLPIAERVEILRDQMMLEEKAGRFFHTMIMPGENGGLEAKNSPFELPDVKDLLLTKGMTHFSVLGSAPSGKELAARHNALQEVAVLAVTRAASRSPASRLAAGPC